MDEAKVNADAAGRSQPTRMTPEFDRELTEHVRSGAITQQTADKIRREMAAGGRDATETETPKIARGFNDVLLALGVAFITIALMSQWMGSSGVAPVAVYATFPVLWLVSELLDVRRKAVLPGIIAVIGMSLAAAYIGGRFGYSVGEPVPAKFDGSFSSLVRFPARVLMFSAASIAAVNALYYARFRLPFALLPLALGIGIAAVQALILLFGWEQTAAIPHILGLAFGIALFATAMWYDTSDPLRRTRNADCGFWLHLAAAPLIVHSLLSIFGGTSLARSSGGSGLTIALIAALTIIALLIDRRALIVSSLSYLLAAVGYIVSTASALLGGSLFATLIVIGIVVIVVGMGWQPARGVLLAPFRGQSWLAKLPPVKA